MLNFSMWSTWKSDLNFIYILILQSSITQLNIKKFDARKYLVISVSCSSPLLFTKIIFSALERKNCMLQAYEY